MSSQKNKLKNYPLSQSKEYDVKYLNYYNLEKLENEAVQ